MYYYHKYYYLQFQQVKITRNTLHSLTRLPGHGKKIRTIYSRGLDYGLGFRIRHQGSQFLLEGPRVWQETPEENRRINRPKRCVNNNKDEVNSSNTLNNIYHPASSKKILTNKDKILISNDRGETFTNIDCKDLYEKKHSNNVISLKIY